MRERAVREAERALRILGDLGCANAPRLKSSAMTVEAARITMISLRSRHDEVRREGDARTEA